MVRLREVYGQNPSPFPALHAQSLYSTHMRSCRSPVALVLAAADSCSYWGMTGESCMTANSPAVLFAHLVPLLCHLGSCIGELSISCGVRAPSSASLHRDFTVYRRRNWTGALVILKTAEAKPDGFLEKERKIVHVSVFPGHIFSFT